MAYGLNSRLSLRFSASPRVCPLGKHATLAWVGAQFQAITRMISSTWQAYAPRFNHMNEVPDRWAAYSVSYKIALMLSLPRQTHQEAWQTHRHNIPTEGILQHCSHIVHHIYGVVPSVSPVILDSVIRQRPRGCGHSLTIRRNLFTVDMLESVVETSSQFARILE